MLLVHILIAISSLIYSGYVFFKPSKKKINIAYALVAATIATGTYLVVLMPSHMVSACISGLVYLAAVSVGIVFANKKLARQSN
jgi:hypothetical protein